MEATSLADAVVEMFREARESEVAQLERENLELTEKLVQLNGGQRAFLWLGSIPLKPAKKARAATGNHR